MILSDLKKQHNQKKEQALKTKTPRKSKLARKHPKHHRRQKRKQTQTTLAKEKQ